MNTDMHHPFGRFGLLTMKDLERMFNVSDDTITRAYKRGDFPRPIVLFRQHVWTEEAIRHHLAQRQEAARLQDAREQAQRETKIQSLYGGKPYGRRP
jgi:predicted DNA-binding transcriptional regulator AlpA